MSEVLELLATELDDRRIADIASHLGASQRETEAAVAAALPTLIAAFGRTIETEQGSQFVAKQMQAFGGGSLGELLGGLLGGSERSTDSRSPSNPIPPRSTPHTAPQTNKELGFEEILPPGFEPTSNDQSRSRPSSSRLPPPEPRAPSERKESPLDRSLGPGNELPPSRNPYPPSSQPSDDPTIDRESMDDVLGNVLGGKKKRVEEAINKSSGLDLRKIGPLLMILAPLVLGAMRARAGTKSAGNSKSIDPNDLSEMMRGERASLESKPGGSIIGKMLDQDGDGDFDLSDMVKLGM